MSPLTTAGSLRIQTRVRHSSTVLERRSIPLQKEAKILDKDAKKADWNVAVSFGAGHKGKIRRPAPTLSRPWSTSRRSVPSAVSTLISPKKNPFPEKTHKTLRPAPPEPVLSLFCLLPTCPRTAFPFVKIEKTKTCRHPRCPLPPSVIARVSHLVCLCRHHLSSISVGFGLLLSSILLGHSRSRLWPSPSPRVADFVLKVSSTQQSTSASTLSSISSARLAP
jgi:hypothetical protein